MSDESKHSPDAEHRATLVDWIRWLGALAAVAGAALLVVGSHYISGLQVCEYSADAPSHEMCKPYPVEAIIPLLVLALALMWRDLSEFSISGVGSVVRRIDDKQQKLQEGQAALQGQLSVIQSQTLTNNFNFGGPLKEEFEWIKQREPGLAAEAEETLTAWSDLEEAWVKLEPWSRLAIRLKDPYFRDLLASTSFDPDELEAKLAATDRNLVSATGLGPDTDLGKVEAWASGAQRRLELVRRAVRVGSTLPEPQIEQALGISRDLLHELKEEELAEAD